MQKIKTIDRSQFIGREIGNVAIVKELGSGGMGVVFVGFQKSLKRPVAVKVLPKAVAPGAESKELFRIEAETVAILTHPNIIPIFDMGETIDFFYQVMQLVKGDDLGVVLNKCQKHPVPKKRLLPLTDTIDIIIQILDGLSYAHEEEIVHQDIKPGNILLDGRTRRPLIVDFGIAKVAHDEYRSQGVVVGTPLYMSPEQARGLQTDGRTDIYAAGVMLFKMATGTLPLKDNTTKDLLIRKRKAPQDIFIKSPSETSDLVDSALEEIILKAIAIDPEDRYQDCFQFKNELEQYNMKLKNIN